MINNQVAKDWRDDYAAMFRLVLHRYGNRTIAEIHQIVRAKLGLENA